MTSFSGLVPTRLETKLVILFGDSFPEVGVVEAAAAVIFLGIEFFRLDGMGLAEKVALALAGLWALTKALNPE